MCDVSQQQVTSRQLIEQSLEQMITEINAKRARDQTLLESEFFSQLN